MDSPYKMDLAYGRARGSYYHGLLSQPECWQCPLQMDTKVFPDGPIPARIAFVGEEPGCLLPNQYVTVGESPPFLINTLDKVPDGVTATSNGFYTGKVYRISAMGHPCTLTKNHKIKVAHVGSKASEWVEAQDAAPGMRVIIPKRKGGKRKEDSALSSGLTLDMMRGSPLIEHAIVAGAFMACGWCFKDTHVVKWVFPPESAYNVYAVVRWWLEQLGLEVIVKDIDGSKLVSVLDSDVAEIITDEYYKWQAKIPPDFLFKATVKQQSAFLYAWSSCLPDTIKNNSWTISTTSKEAYARATELFIRLGVVPYASVKPVNTVTYSEVYTLFIEDHEAKRIGWPLPWKSEDSDELYYSEDEENFYVPINRCESFVYSGPVYDLTTESEEYNAPFTVHNSSELLRGKGFVGPSGQLLWYIAKACGIPREDVWVTNSALCQARPVKLANGAIIPKMYVKAKAAMCCRTRLLRELITVDPVVIVPLGNWALWAITDIPKAKIYSYRGSRIDKDLRALLATVEQGMSRAPMKEIRSAT